MTNEQIYDEDSLSLLNDLNRWTAQRPKAAADPKIDLLPIMLQMFHVLSSRIHELDAILVEQLEENTLQPAFAQSILDAFDLAEKAIASALVPSDSEPVKAFRSAVAVLTPQILESVIDAAEDEEVADDGDDETDGEDAEEETVA